MRLHYWLPPSKQVRVALDGNTLPTPPYTVEWDTSEIPDDIGIWEYIPPEDRGNAALVLSGEAEILEVWVVNHHWTWARKVYDAQDFERRLARSIRRHQARKEAT